MRKVRERGAAAIETAMVLPSLVLLIAGGAYFGRTATVRHTLTDIVSAATRASTMSGGTIKPDDEVKKHVGAKCPGGVTVAATDTFIVAANPSAGIEGIRSLTVKATCSLGSADSQGLFGFVTQGTVEAVSTMAYPAWK